MSKQQENAPHNDIVYPDAIPFALVHLACIGAIWSGVTRASVILCIVLYVVRMFGVTAGYHRYFSHRSYRTSRAFQFLLAFVAQSSSQKSVMWWAAVHRHHHKHSDTSRDVHSPRMQGIWYAHVGWIFERRPPVAESASVPDLATYPELRFLQRFQLLPAVVLAVATFLFGGWPGLFVGFFWSTVLLYHGTFFINSLAHVHGRQRYETGDDSRNNWWLALITLGEGWHNNHHAYQRSTRQGFRWYEIDLAFYALTMLSWFGIVWDLGVPPAHLVANERKPSAARRRGLMRYDADRLSVLWTNATLLVTVLPWLIPMPLWARLVLALPVIYLRSSCAYIQHNQGHLAVFWSKTLNFLFDIELALLTGYVTPLWELQHARGHHRHYLVPEDDPASIIDASTGKPLPRWKYCIRGNLEIIGHSWRIAAEESRRGRADARPRMVAEFLVAGAICVALCVANPVSFIALILVPNVLISFFVWHISYDHHHDVPGTSHYDASHTHVDAGFNWSRFNIGHHAAHHEKPTLHWSLLPQRTAAILDQLDPRTLHGAELPDATAAD